MIRDEADRPAQDRDQIEGVSLAQAPVLMNLPHWRDSEQEGERVPDDLCDAIIVSFGAASQDCGLEGGGLVIDYIPKDRKDVRRVVFAFSDLGMRIAFRGLSG